MNMDVTVKKDRPLKRKCLLSRSPRRYLWPAAVAMILLTLTGCPPPAPEVRTQDAIDHYLRGKLLYEDGEMEAALAELAKAIEADPALATAHAVIGDIFRKQDDVPLAVRAYERAVEANPYNYRNHYNCGALHQMLADAADVLETVQKHLKRATQLYLRTLKLKADDYDATLNLGVCYFRLGDLEEAKSYFETAAEIDPSQPHAHSNLGAIYDNQADYAAAAAMYRRSLERDGEQALVWLNLAHVRVQQEKYVLAVQSYTRVTELQPDSAEPWERLAHCYYFQKHYDKAIDHYGKALAKDPKFAEARRGLGVVFMTQFLMDKSADHLRTQALAEWESSLTIDPDQPTLIELVNKYSKAPSPPPAP